MQIQNRIFSAPEAVPLQNNTGSVSPFPRNPGIGETLPADAEPCCLQHLHRKFKTIPVGDRGGAGHRIGEIGENSAVHNVGGGAFGADPVEPGRNLMQDFGGWHGVGDMLNGLTFGNFCDCLDLLQQSKQAATEKDDPAINEIFQDITLRLYRYKDPEKIPAVPSLLAIHAVNFFSSVWEMVLSGPVYISGEAIDFRILFQKLAPDDRKADDKTGWTGIVFEVAASGVFGNKKEVDDTPFWDVLLYLYKCKFEYLHQKRNKK